MRALAPGLFCLALPVLAGTVLAETGGGGPLPLTAEEFDAYATGKTLTYGQGGAVYGTEQYLPGRQVRWAFREDACQKGEWYPSGSEICFVYEQDTGGPQCWTFFQTEGGLRARFAGDAAGAELSEVAQSSEPLNCPGPDVGV